MSPNNSFIKWVYFSWFQAFLNGICRFGLLLLGSSLLIPLFCFFVLFLVLNLCWWHLHERVRWETTHMGTTPNMTPDTHVCHVPLLQPIYKVSFGGFCILGWFQMKFASKVETPLKPRLGFSMHLRNACM